MFNNERWASIFFGKYTAHFLENKKVSTHFLFKISYFQVCKIEILKNTFFKNLNFYPLDLFEYMDLSP